MILAFTTIAGLIILTFAWSIINIGVLFAIGCLAIVLAGLLTGLAWLLTVCRGVFYEQRRREHF